MFRILLVASSLLAPVVYGHMQMAVPLPVRSPLDKESTDKDYSYTAPLRPDGSDYPCKGYHKDPFRATAEYKPGEEYPLKIVGGASHGGGSCQVALSHDNGLTFRVIKSMIGGCPLKGDYSFTIPPDVPAGNALLAWTWFNRIGNREMYMNCAHVTISGKASTKKTRRAVAFTTRPDPFLANINDPNQCKTREGADIVFPQPGPDVEYASGAQGNAGVQANTGVQAGSSAGFTCSDGPAAANHQPPPQQPPANPPPAPAPSAQPSSPPANVSTPQASAPSPSSLVTEYEDEDEDEDEDDNDDVCLLEDPTSSAPSPSSTSDEIDEDDDVCVPEEPSSRIPIPTLTTSYIPATPLTSPNPLPTTTKSAGQALSDDDERNRESKCKPGTIRCDSETSFSICAKNGKYTHMGKVAPGTRCRGGVVGW